MALPRKDGIPVPGWKEATNEVQTVDATLEALVTTLNTKIDTIDALLDAIIAGTTPATVQLSGRIPEYAWSMGAEQPIPADQTKFAWGYEFEPNTGDITTYGWSGTWVEVVI